MLTKLDMYDYILLPGVIRIVVYGPTDPTRVDILSEISRSGGRVYVEGMFFIYLDRHDIFYDSKNWIMEIEVKRIERGEMR